MPPEKKRPIGEIFHQKNRVLKDASEMRYVVSSRLKNPHLDVSHLASLTVIPRLVFLKVQNTSSPLIIGRLY